jgi:signal transduction histidine kinase
MQGQVQRLTKLSTDLLDLSRVDAGQLRVLNESVDLTEVVELLAGELEHVAISTGHVLETDIEPDLWCSGDVARVLQIGRALATNAMVHTPAGTRVVIRTRRRGDRIEMSVEDNGPGILEQYREAVFGRFYRVDGGMASGSGLGLAIAREIARLMGGAVRLDSNGDPTVFTLDLPAASPADPFSRENGTRKIEPIPLA